MNSQSAKSRVLGLVLALAILLMLPTGVEAQTNVTTQHNDIARTGANTNETILTPANVNSSTFGKLFSQPVDGYIYAQPLYMAGIKMGAGTAQAGSTHNVAYVATENDSVYAFDADNNGGANANPLWKANLLDSAHGAPAGATPVPGYEYNADILPVVGITSTPVIDPSTKTLYVVAASLESAIYVQRLHALDITTGLEKLGGPVALSGSVPGTGNGSSNGILNWDSKWENNRASLLLLNGIVYIAFGSHGDAGPWHGWILAYSASTLKQTGAWCATPNGIGGGIWISGAGLSADVPSGSPYGRMFAATGNGDYTATTPYTRSMDYSDSIVRLDLSNGVPTVSDEFTPQNQAALNAADDDVASGGVLLLPDQGSGGHTHELVQIGKVGTLYVVDRDNPGGFNSSSDNVVQEISGKTGGLWSMPAYWNNTVYVWGTNTSLSQWSLSAGKISSSPLHYSGVTSDFPGATPSVSANGTTDGILWAARTDGYGSHAPAILYAFDATNVVTELYDTTQNATRDAAGAAVKFAVPTVTNGKVYLGTETELDVYGLFVGSTPTATPTFSPTGKSFTGSLNVSISDSTAGATIYYTTDGSTPTTSSSVYTGPINVTSTEMIQALASASGHLQSTVVAQTYTLLTQAAAPLFSPPAGSYSSPQSVTLSDATSGALVYYTTDGTKPTTSSIKYTGAITVNASETIQAIAVASGLTNSPISSAVYTITNGGTVINFSNGFSTAASTMTFNGSTGLDDSRLQLTSGLTNQAGSAFVSRPINIQSFSTEFTFQLSNPAAEGITFAIQGIGATALGSARGGLGYGAPLPGGTGGIAKSMAVKFDLYSDNGEGPDSTGLYTNGASPTTPAIDLRSSGIDLHSDDPMDVRLSYDGTTLAMTIKDVVTGTTFSKSWAVNIPSLVGGNTAYVGFTGSTGTLSSSQKIETWTFATGAPATANAPTFSPAAGTYLGTQSVTIHDTTIGATIYYTTNGSLPTTSSTKYTAPITVTATQTINAIAVDNGYANSAVGRATYTIESQVPAATFSPGGGAYVGPQRVTINDAASGVTIYYTTNGTTPTTSSTQYAGPITVSATETVKAIAVASGFFNSNVASATYTITTGTSAINYGSGFTAGGMVLNGGAKLNGSALEVTDGDFSEISSAWYNTKVNIQKFTTDFTFQITPSGTNIGDGFTFAIQGGSTTAIGTDGGGLGYGPQALGGTGGIANSVAVKFDLYSNNGEGPDSTGLYVDGVSPTTPAVDMTSSGVNLHSGDPFHVHLSYDGTTLTMTITDTKTNAKFTDAWSINIPGTVGGNVAYVGFTGATGGYTAIQSIQTWTLNSGATQAAATPTFSPGAGTYTSAQTVTMSDPTSGATIYYTTNGTTPTTSSTKYTGPITVSATETVKAIAVASGFFNSNVASATYTITTGTSAINYGSGFTAGGMVLNGGAKLNGSALEVTDGDFSEISSAWYNTKVNIQKFTTDFTFQITPSGTNIGDGFTFAIQGGSTTAIGTDGGGLGYGPQALGGTGGIANSVAVKFDLYSNNGEGPDSTGLYVDGVSPTTPAVDMTSSGVNLHSGDPFHVHLSYDGTTLTMTITDTKTNAKFTDAWSINIPGTVGGNVAYVGFTGATGGYTAIQGIQTWTLNSGATQAAATPTFSPGAGTYTSAQTVTMSDPTSGATIYYTTNGTTPTTSSTKYTGPITVSATETVKAIAVASGFFNSNVASATYTITTGTSAINYGSGFTAGGMVLNGGAKLNGSALEVTDGDFSEISSAWYNTKVNIQKFTTDFTFQITPSGTNIGDGFTFAIQGGSTTAIGTDGGGLGYGPQALGGTGGIANSVAVKFDLYSNNGEGPDSTGLYVDGVSPTTPAVDMTSSGVNLHSGDPFHVHLSYDGTTLTMTITDTKTNAKFTDAWSINIPGTVGGNVAYVGFTGATGGYTAIQNIQSWTF